MLSDREILELKKNIIRKLKEKGKTLSTKQLNGLIDEKQRNLAFVKNKKLSVKDLPTYDEIKGYFVDPPEILKKENSEGKYEDVYEIDIDSICLKDKLATRVFKEYNECFWEDGKKIPDLIEEIIKCYNSTKTIRDKTRKKMARARFANICLVGVIRFYKKERQPYFCPFEIIEIVNYVESCMMALNAVKNEPEYDIKGKLYIFDVARTKLKEEGIE